MTIYQRPDERVFSENAQPGEVQEFPDVPRGWGVAFEQSEGKPPMEWFNWLHRRFDRALRYLVQRGIPEWSATEDYPIHARVQHNGATYRALVPSVGVEPGTSVVTWRPWASSSASDIDSGVLSVVRGGTGRTSLAPMHLFLGDSAGGMSPADMVQLWGYLQAVGQRGNTVYSTPGTHQWPRPAWARWAYVRVKGAGGGGACLSTPPAPGGGGEGGSWEGFFDVSELETVLVTVGTGGTAGTSDGIAGGNGGTSSFGSLCSATGGYGGSTNGNVAAGGVGTGTAGVGRRGEYGEIGMRNASGGSFCGGAGGGGGSPFAEQDASRAVIPGSGGGGRRTSAGAPGAHGIVEIWVF